MLSRAAPPYFVLTALVLGACLGDIADNDSDDHDASSAGDGGAAADATTIDGRPDAAHGTGEPAALAGITLAHNEVRAGVGVAPLVWDPALAAIAQAWADACVDNDSPIGLIDHNANRSDDYPGYVGENIYGSSGAATGPAAVSSWASEVEYYDYDTNTCTYVCGHYTQLVWAASEKLGCGISSCPGLSYGNGIVCNYSPGGNSGGRPY
jgi:pathogenesis-related protein 1